MVSLCEKEILNTCAFFFLNFYSLLFDFLCKDAKNKMNCDIEEYSLGPCRIIHIQ